MNWRRRIPQWIEALRLAGVRNVPWFGLVRAVWSGPVPRAVWRERLRYGCFRCPLYSSVQMPGTTKKTDRVALCRSTHPAFMGLGCNCYLPFLAMAAEPHPEGCFGKTLPLTLGLGWGPHIWPSRWARVRSVIDFLRRK